MRIGIITDETDTQLVGFGIYTLELTKNILLIDKKNEYYLIHRRKEDHEIYKMGAKEIIVPYNPRFPFSTIRNFITLPLKLRKYNLDVVHHMTGTGPFVFKQLLKGKSVEIIHEIEPILYPQNFELSVKLVFRFLLPRIVKNVDYILTACNSAKMDISRHFKVPLNKIGVVYPGTNSLFKPMDKRACKEKIRRKFGIKEDYILFVSTLEAKKNIPTLLKAYKKLKDGGCKHKLVLVGRKGYGYEKIESVMKRLKLEKDVIMTGYVPFSDLPIFYNAAAVFVFPPYEALCMPVIDAMKCGCPIIVSNGGGGPEAFGSAGIIVEVSDSEGYAKAIKEVLENKKLAGSMRRKSLKRAKDFSWKKSAKKVIDVYERLNRG
ncbi:glycosyltransferase family 4 protein [Candidatus Woesearchaeota archaeon]|nr:glycosyltransferase family 4 protein [Candidatus Woesearchaeota archaeon]